MTAAAAIGAACGLLLAGATAAVAQPTFRARVEGVRIDALVTADGRPLAGLQPADFEVRDNGVPQAIDLVSAGDVPINVVLTLDVSGSVQGARLAALRRAAGVLLDALVPADAAGLITFDRVVQQQVALTREIETVREAFARPAVGRDTALVDAALGAMLLGDADATRTLVVIFSDGIDTASFVQPELVVETARRLNGVVYGVSSSEDDPEFLRDLAATTGGRVIEIGQDGDPGPAFLEILQEFRRRYVITFTPAGVAGGGWHKLDVRVKRPGARVRARAGYVSTTR